MQTKVDGKVADCEDNQPLTCGFDVFIPLSTTINNRYFFRLEIGVRFEATYNDQLIIVNFFFNFFQFKIHYAVHMLYNPVILSVK